VPASNAEVADAWVFGGARAVRTLPPTGYPQLSTAGDEMLTVAFSGTLFEPDRLREQPGVDRDQPLEPAALVLRAYTQLGEGWMRSLRGHYAIVIIDQRRNRTIAVRDAMGLHPLLSRVESTGCCSRGPRMPCLHNRESRAT